MKTKGNNYYSIKYRKKKDLPLLATKLIKKIPDVVMLKKNMNDFWKKIKQLLKPSEKITQQSKNIENLDIIDIKLFTTEVSKTSSKLSETMKHV